MKYRTDAAFDTWLARIDGHLAKVCGMGHDDLPDCPYRDWFEAGVTPYVAAKRVIRNAKEG